jgi:hypothetical protein
LQRPQRTLEIETILSRRGFGWGIATLKLISFGLLQMPSGQ